MGGLVEKGDRQSEPFGRRFLCERGVCRVAARCAWWYRHLHLMSALWIVLIGLAAVCNGANHAVSWSMGPYNDL